VALARAAVREALAQLKIPRDAELAIALISDAEMRALNARHRGRDRVTDVLSFGAALPRGVRGADALSHLEHSLDGSVELGDIVIAIAQAKRQARRRRWSMREELAFLAAHGALHLVGYDDDSLSGYREMRRLGLSAVRTAQKVLRRRRQHKRPEH
jgi:probable rRNA maturation factor